MKKYRIYIDEKRCTPQQVERIKRYFNIPTPGQTVNGEYIATCETPNDEHMLKMTALKGFIQVRQQTK